MQSWNTYIHDSKKTSEEVFYDAYAWRATVEAIATDLARTCQSYPYTKSD